MILGIDPGYTHSAWVAFDQGIPQRFEREENAQLLARLRGPVWPINGTLAAVEMIASYGMPVGKEVFETVLWIGRFVEAWAMNGGEYKLVYRRDVKLHLCHSARATDANIRAAILDHYGPGRDIAIGKKKTPGPLYGLSGDQWSALAVAMTVADRERRSTDPEREQRIAQAEARGQAF